MLITVLGSCRQYGVRHYYPTTCVQEDISYTHYTKEILQVIYFCKYGNLSLEQTMYTFRSPILHKSPFIYNTQMRYEFDISNLYLIEIASKKSYRYNDVYVHSIAVEDKYDVSIRKDIVESIQTKEEIEEDILKMNEILEGKIIIVGHLVTQESGERYILKGWVEDICKRHSILFIDPIKELKKVYSDLDDLFVKEDVLSHYTEAGHCAIGRIYNEYILTKFGNK